MFTIKNPSTLGKPWQLSIGDDSAIIPEDVTSVMANYQLMGVQFLYNNFRKKFKGAILNEEYDMNCPFQVAAFLRAISSDVILVICPDNHVCTWHYHLTKFGKYETTVITEKNSSNLSQLTHNALIVKFSDINKLLNNLLDYNFSVIIIDELENVAKKLIIRRLNGGFHIGLTYQKFKPDPNILWHMLNWSNPGCLMKLSEFSEIYARKHLSFHLWWFRLSWQFCESFKIPTKDELDKLNETLIAWAKKFNIETKTEIVRSKRKKVDDKSKDEKKKKPKIDDSSIEISETNLLKNKNVVIEKDKLERGTSEKCVISKEKNEEEEDAETFLTNLVKSSTRKAPSPIRNVDDEITDILQKTDALLKQNNSILSKK